jgi:hypothetical protein
MVACLALICQIKYFFKKARFGKSHFENILIFFYFLYKFFLKKMIFLKFWHIFLELFFAKFATQL